MAKKSFEEKSIEAKKSATAVIRGKTTRFTSRLLKDGTLALYRDGRRAWNSYQRRLARGVLEGKTVAEATGRKPGGSFTSRWKDKFYGRSQINQNFARYADPLSKDPGAGKYGTTGHEGEVTSTVSWAEPPNNEVGAFERRTYYALVSVQVSSLPNDNYEIDPAGEGCTPITMALLLNRPEERGGILTGMTRAEFRANFEKLVEKELARRDLIPCTGDLRKDVIAIWRHARR